MKKMVWLQIGLALFAFGITARIFFKERPYAAQNHELQQELTQVKETNEQLEENMSAVKVDRKASRSYIRQGRAFFSPTEVRRRGGTVRQSFEGISRRPLWFKVKNTRSLKQGTLSNR